MAEQLITDQSLLDKLTESIEEPKVAVKTVAPSNSEVALPGGFITREGSLVKYAEVRELTGVDEEAISKEMYEFQKAIIGHYSTRQKCDVFLQTNDKTNIKKITKINPIMTLLKCIYGITY